MCKMHTLVPGTYKCLSIVSFYHEAYERAPDGLDSGGEKAI